MSATELFNVYDETVLKASPDAAEAALVMVAPWDRIVALTQMHPEGRKRVANELACHGVSSLCFNGRAPVGVPNRVLVTQSSVSLSANGFQVK
jgi:hypothetical protein